MSDFSEKLQKKVKKLNERQNKNFEMYAAECRRQGKKVGEPIDLMSMVEHELESGKE
jgi:hypothetical protein